ncbi:CoA transferase subunit A [Tepidibacter sp. Z1-5]|uniref:CoA transferase subunit A n=1 Tax=Tepidibacter sp. Z1-5 TaxID=3134138 RepID=UPI0030C0B0D4
MKKRLELQDAINMIDDGMTLMIGGFMAVGSPHAIIEGLLESGKKDLTIICNDTSFIDKGIGKLIVNNQVKKVITSHIGTNRETGRQMNEGLIEVELVPQGTLAEQIRAGGAGLGGVLTPIGIGTPVEDNNEVIEVDGKRYILAKGIKADIALIHGSIVDEKGNIFYNQSTRNFNPLMASAADVVIVEAEKVVKSGELDPHMIATPGLFVDHIVEGA